MLLYLVFNIIFITSLFKVILHIGPSDFFVLVWCDLHCNVLNNLLRNLKMWSHWWFEVKLLAKQIQFLTGETVHDADFTLGI